MKHPTTTIVIPTEGALFTGATNTFTLRQTPHGADPTDIKKHAGFCAEQQIGHQWEHEHYSVTPAVMGYRHPVTRICVNCGARQKHIPATWENIGDEEE